MTNIAICNLHWLCYVWWCLSSFVFWTALWLWRHTYLLCRFIMLWHRETRITDMGTWKTSWTIRGLNSKYSDWGNITSCQLFNTFVPHYWDCQNTVSMTERVCMTLWHHPESRDTYFRFQVPYVLIKNTISTNAREDNVVDVIATMISLCHIEL